MIKEIMEKNRKCVTFSNDVTIHYMEDFIEESSLVRQPFWEIFASDRCRFQRRIVFTEKMLRNVLSPDYWRNKQRSVTENR